MMRKLLPLAAATVCLIGAKPAAAQFLYYPGWSKTMPNGSTLTDTAAGVFSFSNGAANTATLTVGPSGAAAFGGDLTAANMLANAQVRAGASSGIFWNASTDMKAPFNGGWRMTPQNDTILTVSGLGTCNSTNDSTRSFVSDATLATFGSTVAGGGSNHVPVYCDGGNSLWKVG